MCIGVCCKNITFFHSIVCLFRHSHITSYSPAFQVISLIRPPGQPAKIADRRIWRMIAIATISFNTVTAFFIITYFSHTLLIMS